MTRHLSEGWQPELVALDIDGTLFAAGHGVARNTVEETISPAVRKAVDKVIDVAAGDLGLSAQRKFDCEAWIPTQGKYRELTSTSNCTDFKARRLDIRGRFAEGTRPLATLNGTLCAMTRTIVAILETHQQADGSVVVPEALRPYLQGREVLEPVAT